jgi:hypothetical protein
MVAGRWPPSCCCYRLGIGSFCCEIVAIRLLGFVAVPLGKVLIMDQTQLLERIVEATTPNETSTAIYDARRWLADHPEDQTVRYAMAGLMGFERDSLNGV